MIRKFIVGLGILLMASGLVFGGIWIMGNNASAEIVQVVPVPETSKSTILYFDLSTPKESSVQTTMVVEPTSTQEPMISGYVLDQTIDLSAKAPVALTMHLADDKLMSTNWAGTIGYQDTDDQKTIFAPSKGVIYSYQGDVLTTWAHSGTGVGGTPYFFATNWDLYIRKNPENKTVSLSEAQVKAETLKGITAYLCQVPSGTIAYLSDHDANSQCPGEEIELELVAVAIVPHEKLEEYNAAILDINSWMISNYPDAGFENLSKDNGWLIRFCIGQFSDQESDGTPWYSYNAGVIGFRVKDGSS